jgi:hypothetical protein
VVKARDLTFHAGFQPDYVLQANDIFFVDLGAVFEDLLIQTA